jgi:hypothetical protein
MRHFDTCYDFDYDSMDAGYDAADAIAEMAHDAAALVASAGAGGHRPEVYQRRYNKAAPAALEAINNGGDYDAAKRAARKALRN